MMKNKSYIYIYLVAAIAVIIATIALIRINLRVPDVVANLSVEDFTGERYSDLHYNSFLVDSFIELNRKAYGDLITIEKEGGQLELRLNNTNQLGSDYYNNNDGLKSLTLREHGFEVVDDAKNNIIVARFAIHKANFVNVPNDVTMSLMYKVYNK